VRILPWLLSAALGLISACKGGRDSTLPTVVPEDDTTLGAGDVFTVRVYGEDDLSNEYRIAQDGSIDFPLVGRIEVEGHEPTEVADLIASRLREREMLISPQVSVVVDQYNSKRFNVMGAVAQPGTFPMTAGLTVVQAISLAGGLTALASGNSVVVSRRVDGELKRYRIPVSDVSRGEAEDFPLRAGDIVYVPERLF